MGLLDDQLAVDAQFAFTDPDAWAETVIYKKKSGETRTIKGQGSRFSPVLSADGRAEVQMRFWFLNSSTLGIAWSELDTGGDKITVAYRRGGAAKDYSVRLPDEPIEQDSGMICLDLF